MSGAVTSQMSMCAFCWKTSKVVTRLQHAINELTRPELFSRDERDTNRY